MIVESIAGLIKASWWLWSMSIGTFVFIIGYAVGFRELRYVRTHKINPVGCVIGLVLLSIACALLTTSLYHVETHDFSTLAVEMPTRQPLPQKTPKPGDPPWANAEIQPIFSLDQILAGFINVCAFIISLFYPKSLCVGLFILFMILAVSKPD